MMDVPSKINDRQKREDIAFEEEDFNPNGGKTNFFIKMLIIIFFKNYALIIIFSLQVMDIGQNGAHVIEVVVLGKHHARENVTTLHDVTAEMWN